MNSISKVLYGSLALPLLLVGQPSNYPLFAQAPTPINGGNATVVGNLGNQQYFYYIVARYPIGNAVHSPAFLASNAPATLTNTNFVRISWNAIINATGYDVLRLTGTTGGTFPASGTCLNCFIISNTTTTTFDDKSNATLGGYIVSQAPSANANIALDNVTQPVPAVTFDAPSNVNIRLSSRFGLDASIARQTKPNRMGMVLPITCSTGETFFLTATNTLYNCGPDNVETPVGIGAGGYATIQDEGVSLLQRTILNMKGAGVTCVDNAGTMTTDCTIPGGGGGGSLVTSTPTVITMTSGVCQLPGGNGNVFYVTDATVTHTAGVADNVTLTAGYDSACNRTIWRSGAVADAYTIVGFLGNAFVTPTPASNISTHGTVIVTAGVFGAATLRPDAYAPTVGTVGPGLITCGTNCFELDPAISSGFDPLDLTKDTWAITFQNSQSPTSLPNDWNSVAINSNALVMASPAGITGFPGLTTFTSNAFFLAGSWVLKKGNGVTDANPYYGPILTAGATFRPFTVEGTMKFDANILDVKYVLAEFAQGSFTTATGDSDYVGVRFDPNGGDTRFMCDVRSGGVSTVTSAAALPTVVANTLYKIIVSATAAGVVTCSVNGTSTTTTATFPTPAGVSPGFEYMNSRVFAAHILSVGTMRGQITGN